MLSEYVKQFSPAEIIVWMELFFSIGSDVISKRAYTLPLGIVALRLWCMSTSSDRHVPFTMAAGVWFCALYLGRRGALLIRYASEMMFVCRTKLLSVK